MVEADVQKTTPPRAERVLFDFEEGNFDGWEMEGNPFGGQPIHVRDGIFSLIPRGPNFSGVRFVGWQGDCLVSTPLGTQQEGWRRLREQYVPPGRITSASFLIDRDYLRFRMAGMLNPGMRAELLVDGQTVQVAYGNNSYDLRDRGWDVRSWAGRQGRIRLVQEPRDREPVLFRVDDFRLSDQPPDADWAQQRLHERDSFALRHGEYRLIVPSEPHRFAQAKLVRGPDQRWHLFAVREEKSIYQSGENHALLHASADHLQGPWSTPQVVFTIDPQQDERSLSQIFPVVHEGNFYLFYHARDEGRVMATETQPQRRGPERIFLATSPDGISWNRHPRHPLLEQSPTAVDQFVTRVGDRWVMYMNGGDPPRPQRPIRQAVMYRTSGNLMDWSDPKVAMLDGGPSADTLHEAMLRDVNVFEKDGYWYLIAGPSFNTFGGRVRYLYRGVWRSKDPFHWDWKRDYTGHLDMIRGGVQVIRDEKGQLHLVNAFSWTGGVWIAPIFVEEQRPIEPWAMEAAAAAP